MGITIDYALEVFLDYLTGKVDVEMDKTTRNRIL